MTSTPARLAVALLLGLGLGLLYGWVIQPVEYFDTTPDSLRADYRTDYVLMVAEAYSAERNLARAIERLAALGPQPPAETVEEAIVYADAHSFPRRNLALLHALADDLPAGHASPAINAP